ncbi:hypothetical protein, variant 1 [Sphaeroforma arctica JP610]|uniref:DNA replication licensing factor MCM7 n=1 Tax=Sphaeroforma arctica JP610 TaxID=667725 RepID=A0A0L0FZ17_9EUKA|nr:hypothetical protein, variant 1 [Sphaeroforma arctica JP610]KNC81213.1 hypothetical protein, variant 1 [Sphaeroforma arctica JP610]|eukprot:XP_014155115.1 hypothetical protein, variant 1 [Sphaeroforma arctica JP610]
MRHPLVNQLSNNQPSTRDEVQNSAVPATDVNTQTTTAALDPQVHEIKRFLTDFVSTDRDGTQHKKYMELMFLGDDFSERTQQNILRYETLFCQQIDALLPEPTEEFDPINSTSEDVIIEHRRMEAVENGHNADAALFRRFSVVFQPPSEGKQITVRNLKASHIGSLVKVKAIVTRTTDVKPKLTYAVYRCALCEGETIQRVTTPQFMPLQFCPGENCSESGSRSKAKLSLLIRGSRFVKYQELRIQELAHQVPVGHTPRAMTVHAQAQAATHQSIKLAKKDERIGLGLGGGAPLCPVVYVYRLLPDTPAAQQNILHCGDEIVSVNGVAVAGKSSQQVAQLVAQAPTEITLDFISFDAVDPEGPPATAKASIWLNAGLLRLSDRFKKQSGSIDGLDSKVSGKEEIETENFRIEINQFENTAVVAGQFLKEFEACGRSLAAMGTAQKFFGENLALNAIYEKDHEIAELLRHTAKMANSCGNQYQAAQFATQDLAKSIQTFTSKVAPDAQVTIDKYLAARSEYSAVVQSIHSMEDEELLSKERGVSLSRCQQGNFKCRRYLRLKEKLSDQLSILQTDVVEKLQLLDKKHSEIITDRFSELIYTLHNTYEGIGNTIATLQEKSNRS